MPFYDEPVWQYHEMIQRSPTHHGVVIVSLSYTWAGPDHPGPTGEQLRDVAKYLKWLQTAKDYENCTIAVFLALVITTNKSR